MSTRGLGKATQPTKKQLINCLRVRSKSKIRRAEWNGVANNVITMHLWSHLFGMGGASPKYSTELYDELERKGIL